MNTPLAPGQNLGIDILSEETCAILSFEYQRRDGRHFLNDDWMAVISVHTRIIVLDRHDGRAGAEINTDD